MKLVEKCQLDVTVQDICHCIESQIRGSKYPFKLIYDSNKKGACKIKIYPVRSTTGTRENSDMMNDHQEFAGPLRVRNIMVAVPRLPCARHRGAL